MMYLAGTPALTRPAKQKLLKKISSSSLAEDKLEAQYIYFVKTSRNPNDEEKIKLGNLLSPGEEYDLLQGISFLVVPRLGTISPWSSKATDIAQNAGLDFVTRIERAVAYAIDGVHGKTLKHISLLVHDRMTEMIIETVEEVQSRLFATVPPRPLRKVDIQNDGKRALIEANKTFGLALSNDEVEYLYESYIDLKRSPTDIELMMFAQVNSEHCRHKIFNADWLIDGKAQPKSLFKMIKNTYKASAENILSAYSDNSAVLKGRQTEQFFSDPRTNEYGDHKLADNMVIKVETHNHPTAIAPFPGAATGTGGEIRDEGATGRGARSKMGMAGYNVSNLMISGYEQPWEKSIGKPANIADPLAIMVDAPLGAAAFANEFGRPNLLGYFRTFQQQHNHDTWGYHKPIMVAGGAGSISGANVAKKPLYPGAKLIVLGGPAMLIGLGGSAASSMQTGESEEHLDFASVQRGNPEMQRRAQEVISALAHLEERNPVLSIHDVGAGGLSNAFPELVHDSGLGATFELRDIPCDDNSMSPMEIWCNESQERYVLALDEKDLPQLEALCKRERCPYAVVGEATEKQQLVITDRNNKNNPVDIPMEVLFGKPPKMTRSFTAGETTNEPLKLETVNLATAVERVLKFPAVGSKKFLITIGDRNVGGLTTRDQMIGRWQVPVSDVAVTASSFHEESGQAMSVGERPPLALIDAAAAARMSVGEALTNILAADVASIKDIKLSANWMAAAGYKNEDEKLFRAVEEVGEEFCPSLGITIPVGKDSLSMRATWQEAGTDYSVTSPLSLIITTFAPVRDTNKTLTPELDITTPSKLLYVDLGSGRQRLGGSALAQVFNQIGDSSPDTDAATLKRFFSVFTSLKMEQKVLAYHDRSDGGLLAAFAEMAFTVRKGLAIDLTELPGSALEKLFNEELGVVLQVREIEVNEVKQALSKALPGRVYQVGGIDESDTLTFSEHGKLVYSEKVALLEEWWSQTSFEIQKLRDNPACAQEEYNLISQSSYGGLFSKSEPPLLSSKYHTRPRVAIFREEGVNGQTEMAAAFHEAGFTAVDVHLNDIRENPALLEQFSGLVACGGFSYGDVLGAGRGWANSILFNQSLKTAFADFFKRTDTFTFGVCNGCQMLSCLKEIIPGAEQWPAFTQNTSGRFEARWAVAKVKKSPSIMFKGMEGACLPIPVAHGEGKTSFVTTSDADIAESELSTLQYVESNGNPTAQYPLNPNGSAQGHTAFTSQDGRVTIMMPHPERAFLAKQFSWHPKGWGEYAPWFRLFQNARHWVDLQTKNEESP